MLRSLANSCLKVGGSALTLPRNGISPAYQLLQTQFSRCFSAILPQNSYLSLNDKPVVYSYGLCGAPSRLPMITPLLLQQPARTVVKFSLGKGKRQTVTSVIARFKRLDWGIWIRRMAGAHRRLWRKTNRRKMRLRRHVLVNATRSYMLDKMVSKYWRTPKYWVDDPYEPYHSREEFNHTRRQPRPLPAGVSFPLDQ